METVMGIGERRQPERRRVKVLKCSSRRAPVNRPIVASGDQCYKSRP